METKFILEDYDGNRYVFDSVKSAMRKAWEWLNETYDKYGQYKVEHAQSDMAELIETFLNPDYEGFSIEDFCWCYSAVYIHDEN
jgi:hypothetical protein